jgi:hypothetical protein
MALLGGCVTATDLSPNLPLLRTNCAATGEGLALVLPCPPMGCDVPSGPRVHGGH